MVKRCDRRSQSPGESRLRLTVEDFGFEVEPQFRVFSSQGHLLGVADLRVKGTRLLLEFDGAP